MIICCGEALIDMIANDHQGQKVFAPIAGGGSLNTAIGLGRLGISVSLLTGISKDLFGQQLEQTLIRSDVATHHLSYQNRPTALAFVDTCQDQAHYTFYDQQAASKHLTLDDLPVLDDQTDALLFGGISLIDNPAADTYLAFAKQHANNKLIVIDPNIRVNVIKDEKDYRQRLAALFAVADIIKISDQDLDWIVPPTHGLSDIQNISHQVSQLSQAATLNQWVLVTRGSEACMVFGAEGNFTVPVAKASHIVDTVGAGDSYNAGYLAFLAYHCGLKKSAIQALDNQHMYAALEYASRVAGITVMRHGADMPWLHELN